MQKQRIWATLDPFVEAGESILGRKVANVDFLTAFLQANPYDAYHFFTATDFCGTFLQEWLQKNFPKLYNRNVFSFFPHTTLHKQLATTEYFCFHLSDCIERQVSLQRYRNLFSPTLFPITGVTHSLSYNSFMGNYFSHIWQGCTKRDSIIATSHSAVAMLTNTFTRLQSTYSLPDTFALPALNRIPLGILPPQALPETIQAMKATLQEKLATPTLPTVFLCLGRLDVQSKMDFMPLLHACKRAEKLGLNPNSYCVVLAGWAQKENKLPKALEGYAKALGIQLAIVVRPTNVQRDALYSLADVFLSPSDNIQETFGLTVIEAAMSGVPAIVSDFDGYKDTVVHGETGLRIPTVGFGTSAEASVLAGLWGDNQYHFKLAQQVVVDVPVFAQAIARLGTDKELRKYMGVAAQKRAQEKYAWSTVINQYCELWETLAQQPITEEEEQEIRQVQHPLEFDFANFFAQHFTTIFRTNDESQVRRTALGTAVYKNLVPAFLYAGLESMLDLQVLHQVLFLVRTPVTIKELYTKLQTKVQVKTAGSYVVGHIQDEMLRAHILWALKHDYIEVVPQ